MNMFEKWRDGDDARKDVTNRVMSAVPRRRQSGLPGWLAALLGGAAGAAAAYLLDPERGRTRRARLGDQAAARLRDLGGAVERGTKRAGTQAFAIRQQASHRGNGQPMPNDSALSDKVTTELFGDPSIPQGKININVEEGVVVLRGEVDASSQADALIKKAEQIAGVIRVDSLLHVPGDEAPAARPRKRPAVASAGPDEKLP